MQWSSVWHFHMEPNEYTHHQSQFISKTIDDFSRLVCSSLSLYLTLLIWHAVVSTCMPLNHFRSTMTISSFDEPCKWTFNLYDSHILAPCNFQFVETIRLILIRIRKIAFSMQCLHVKRRTGNFPFHKLGKMISLNTNEFAWANFMNFNQTRR